MQACTSFVPPPLNPLLADPLKHVFSFLPLKDLPAVLYSCHFWRQVAQSDYVWQHIARRDFEYTLPLPKKYCSWYEFVKTKVQIQKTLEKKTYEENIFPDLVDQFSLLSLSHNSLCHSTDTDSRRIQTWPVTGGRRQLLLNCTTSPTFVEVVQGRLFVLDKKYLHTIDIATKTQCAQVALQNLASVEPIHYTKLCGNKFFLGASNGTLGVWNTATGKQERLYLGLSSKICHLDYAAPYVACAQDDGKVVVWDDAGRISLNQQLPGCCRLFVYKDMLLTVDQQLHVTVWDLTKNSEIGTVSTIYRTHIGKGLQPLIQIIAPFMIISESGWSVDVWNLETKTKEQVLTQHKAPLSHFALSEHTFFSGSRAGDIAIWSVTDEGLVLQHHYFMHQGAIRKIVLLDTDLILSYADDQKAHIWKPSNGQLLTTFSLRGFYLIDVIYAKKRLLFVSGTSVAAITFSPKSTTTSPRLSYQV